MPFRADVLDVAKASYDRLTEYHKSVRAFYEIIDVRFRIAEYGVRLAPVGSNQLFSNASGYKLFDDSAYPFYLWLPSWLGRFYVNPDCVPANTPIEQCHGGDVRFVAFIWTWLGFNDAYVSETKEPECWFGVADPVPVNRTERVLDMADMMWKYFRIERTCEGESEGWLVGRFDRNAIGCELTGRWFLKRVPLAQLSSFYQVEKAIIRPLGEKYSALTRSARDDVPAAPRELKLRAS